MAGSTDGPGPDSGRSGEPGATLDGPRVEALHEAHAEELRRFVFGVVRDAELAADVLQATFTRAIERGHEARPESLKGWLFQVAYREALAARRRSAARGRGLQRLALLRLAEMQPPEDPVARAEAIEAVREALDELPEEQRKVVRARMYEEKTFAQIASEGGVPLGTVLTRMRRALERLRGRLDPGTGD